MKKNLLIVFLLIFFLASAVYVPVFADGESNQRIVTDFDLDEEEHQRLEEFLNSYYENHKVDIVFYITRDMTQWGPGYNTSEEWAQAVIDEMNHSFYSDRSIILFTLEGKTRTASCYTNPQSEGLLSPKALRILSENFLLPYYENGVLLKGIENSLDIIDAVIQKREIKIFDFAEILTPRQRETLETRIGELQDKYDMDIVYLLDRNFGYLGDIKYFSSDFYDYMGFGRGERKDGILYTQNFAKRKFCTLGTGRGEDKFTADLLDELQREFVNYMKNDDFFGAYLQQFDGYERVLSGKYFAAEKMRTFSLGVGISLLVAIVATVLAAFSQKVVLKKSMATEYIVPGELVLTENVDRYTHTTTTKTKISKDNDSGGGGSFRGSSGTSHSSSSGSY